jgi:tetratricopeptide (TPR) repeat protein
MIDSPIRPQSFEREVLDELERLSMADPHRGVELGQATLASAGEISEIDLANLHRLIAACAHYARWYEPGLTHASEAARRFAALGDDAAIVRCEMIAAVAEAGLGLPARGISRLQAAIKLAESAGAREMEILAWGNLSHLYWQAERFDLARDCTQRAIALSILRENPRRLGILSNNLAEIYCRLGEYVDAASQARIARELLDGEGSVAYLANIAETESQIYEHQGDLESAAMSLIEAISYAEKAGSHRQKVSYRERLGRVRMRQERMAEAREALEKAKAETLEMDFPHRLDEICDALSHVYVAEGRAKPGIDSPHRPRQAHLRPVAGEEPGASGERGAVRLGGGGIRERDMGLGRADGQGHFLRPVQASGWKCALGRLGPRRRDDRADPSGRRDR